MADRWMDEREELDRMDRERRYGRYRRDEYSASDYGSSDYGERSFQPRERDRDRDRSRNVFGERESGVNYTSAARGGDRSLHYGYESDRAGRFYGDDGRERIYRQEYRPSSITRGGAQAYGTGRYGAERPGEGRWRHDEEHAYRVAYGDHHPDHRGHYESRDSGHDDRNFWERASDRVASWFGEGDYEGQREHRDHRGRGPTGYKRADERISDEAHERLTDDPWVDASAISVAVASGEITLSGTVPERESKHRAERIVERLSGVTHVQNNLRVQRNPLTDAGRGFGDSANAAQIEGAPKTPRTN